METLRILVPRFMRKHVWRKSYNQAASKKPVSAAAPQQPEEVHTLAAAMAVSRRRSLDGFCCMASSCRLV